MIDEMIEPRRRGRNRTRWLLEQAADMTNSQWRAWMTLPLTVFVLAAAVFGASGAGAVTIEDLNEAGKAAYARGDYTMAESLFAQAIKRQPREPLFHYHRAIALTRLERWREAVQAYEATLALKPPANLAAAATDGMRTLAPLLKRGPALSTEGELITVPLKRAGGVWWVEVTLNDSRTTWFMIDTGATWCTVSPELADSLDMRPGADAPTANLQTANGRTSGPLVLIPSIRVGDVEAKNVPAVVLASADLRHVGILGNSFLSRYVVTLDSENSVLTLRPR
jgi:clan AA aspartic protease (TIGR02281 family)